MSTWRVGTKLGRTLYKDNELVGLMDTPELARAVVAALNLVEALHVAEQAKKDSEQEECRD